MSPPPSVLTEAETFQCAQMLATVAWHTAAPEGAKLLMSSAPGELRLTATSRRKPRHATITLADAADANVVRGRVEWLARMV